MKITIVSADQMMYISSILCNVFSSLDISCAIISTAEFNASFANIAPPDKHNFYLIYCIFTVNPLCLNFIPNNIIIYNLEQHVNNEMSRHYHFMLSSGTFDSFYQTSKLNLDYCTQNINVVLQKTNFQSLLLNVPIDELSMACSGANPERCTDILFVGIINQKRKTILEELAKRYKITCITRNIFYEDLVPYFQTAKICLNIHFYENAILERVRINEALHHGLFVVSEKPNEQDADIMQYYENLVDFVDTVTEMENKIDYIVTNFAKLKKKRKRVLKKKLSSLNADFIEECKHHFLPLKNC